MNTDTILQACMGLYIKYGTPNTDGNAKRKEQNAK